MIEDRLSLILYRLRVLPSQLSVSEPSGLHRERVQLLRLESIVEVLVGPDSVDVLDLFGPRIHNFVVDFPAQNSLVEKPVVSIFGTFFSQWRNQPEIAEDELQFLELDQNSNHPAEVEALEVAVKGLHLWRAQETDEGSLLEILEAGVVLLLEEEGEGGVDDEEEVFVELLSLRISRSRLSCGRQTQTPGRPFRGGTPCSKAVGFSRRNS